MGLALAACVVTLAALGGPALAQDYVIQYLSEGRAAYGINNAGQVVGGTYWTDRGQHAFRWTAEGGIQDLATPDDRYSAAVDINDSGEVVGCLWGLSSYGSPKAVRWTPAGEMQDLGTLGGVRGVVYDINNLGQVVGFSDIWVGGPRGNFYNHAVLWPPEGGIQDLAPFGEAWSAAEGINDCGQVVGFYELRLDWQMRAFIWSAAGGMQTLGSLGGSGGAMATAVNNAGQVVGHSWTPSGEEHAFLWTAAGGMQDLGVLGGFASYPTDINNLGQVVGRLDLDPQRHQRAFLWTAGAGMQYLGRPGAQSEALGIGDAGQIVGWSDDGAGGRWACLWRPSTPEESLGELASWVADLNLQAGIDNSLDAKLGCALNALGDVNANNDAAAINTLQAFINAVEAQRGDKIGEADADMLMAKALRIIAALGG
jgi:probable HAF family extracellular repeat protein